MRLIKQAFGPPEKEHHGQHSRAPSKKKKKNKQKNKQTLCCVLPLETPRRGISYQGDHNVHLRGARNETTPIPIWGPEHNERGAEVKQA